MRTERNEFQQLVDHQMGNIEWDLKKSNAVLRKLRCAAPAPRAPVFRHAAVFAMAAVAVVVLAFSVFRQNAVPDVTVATQPPLQTIALPAEPADTRAEAVFLARRAVMEKYGLTLQTLGAFRDDCRLTDTGWTVRFFTTNQINSRLAGEYTVTKENGFISAAWTHDGVEKSLYADGRLNRVAWGHLQLLHALTDGAREAMSINMELNAQDGAVIDYNYIEGKELWGDPLAKTEPVSGEMTAEAAAVFASEAFELQFGLSTEEVSQTANEPFLLASNGTLYESAAGIRVWVFCPSFQYEGENYYLAIFINAQTGEVERLEYTTLGNG